MSIISKKICIIGDSGVGKRSLVHCFVERQFSDEYLDSVGVKISRKILELPIEQRPDKLILQLMIWDVTGHNKFKAVVPHYLRNSSGAVIVADVSRPETIKQIPEYIKLFLSINPNSAIIIALNKFDLIAREELEKQFQLKKLKYISEIYPTSAKTGWFVDEIFQQLAYKILDA